MPFCSKCGKQMKPDDVFCSGCGARLDVAVPSSPEQSHQTPFSAETENLSVMSKEESIKLCDKLGTQYHSLERMQREMNEIVDSLNKNATYQPKQYSAFRFFWPYLIYGSVASTICYILALLIFPAAWFFLLACIILPIVFVIVGGVRARSLREACNRDAADNAYRRRLKAEEQKQRLNELTSSERALRTQLAKYNDVVTVNMRSKSRMGYAKKMLEADKARTFDEAMHLI